MNKKPNCTTLNTLLSKTSNPRGQLNKTEVQVLEVHITWINFTYKFNETLNEAR